MDDDAYASAPPLERDAELARAARLLRRARDGSGRVLLVEGPAGMGKTRFLSEARRFAARLGHTVLAARGDELEQEMAFGVARRLFERYLTRTTPAARAALLNGSAHLAETVLGLAPYPGSVPGTLAVRADPFAAVDALYWLTANACERQPMCLAIDDVHWADAPSLRWLRYLASRADDLALFIIAAVRTGEPTADSGLISAVAELPATESIRLGPLSEAAAATMIRAEAAAADDGFCRACWRASGGNPFLLTELIAVIRDGHVRPDEASASQVPQLASPGVSRFVLARVRRLGEPAGRLSRAAAVLGPGARLADAARLACLPQGLARDAADRLRSAQILASGDALDFVHPLVATAVYAEIPASARASGHHRAARELAAAGAPLDAVAAHLLASEPAADEWVVDRLRRAAAHAISAGAPDVAAMYLTRATAEPPPVPARSAVLHELGRAALFADPQLAIGYLRAARDQALDDGQRFASTLSLVKALAHADHMAAAVEALETAVADATDPEQRLRLEAELYTWAFFWADDAQRARRSSQLRERAAAFAAADSPHTGGAPHAAIAVAPALGSLGGRMLLAVRTWDALVRGEPRAEVLTLAGLASAGGFSADEWGFEAPAMIAQTHLYCDRFEHAAVMCDRGITTFTARGWRGTQLAFTYAHRAHVRFRQGALRDAEADAETGWQIAGQLGSRVPAWWYTLGTYLQILIARGDLRRAAEIAGGTEWGDQLPDAVILPIPRVVRGELHAAMGRAGAAADDLIAAGEWLEERGFANPSWCPWRMIAAPQITATRPGQAREIAAEAVHRARRFGAPWALGKALRAAGLVAGGDAGTQLLAESVSVLDGSGAHFEHACSLVEHGAALRRRGYRTDARPPLRAGLDLAVRCGALPLAARARDELAAAGARPRSARLTGPEALTASELRVARLAADGLRNAEIAQTLFVTRKTVEKHLAGAYAKLGIGSRAEIAEALAPGPGRGSRPLP